MKKRFLILLLAVIQIFAFIGCIPSEGAADEAAEYIAAQVANDDGFFAIGGTRVKNTANKTEDFFVAQCNTEGVILWKKAIDLEIYSNPEPDWPDYTDFVMTKIYNSQDGYYIFGESSFSSWMTYYRGYTFMLSLDKIGNVLWQKEFVMDEVEAVNISNDGILSAGRVIRYNGENLIGGNMPIGSIVSHCIQKYDLEMNLLWEFSCADLNVFGFTDITQTGKNIFVTGCYPVYSNEYQYTLHKCIIGLNENGEIFYENFE